MPATEEQKAVWSVLRLLLKAGEDWIRHKRPTRAAAVAEIAERQFTALRDHDLEGHLLHRGNAGSFADHQVIYIEPPPRQGPAVAAIWCRWDFGSAEARCGFYFGLWMQTQLRGAAAHGLSERTDFVGYRYETPETGENHNYYHVQPCRSLGARDEEVAQALPVSQRNPTWPLAAETSLELLLCLVVSLYGKRGLRDLQANVLGNPAMRGNDLLCRSMSKLLDLGGGPSAG